MLYEVITESANYPELIPLVNQLNRAVEVLASAIQPWRDLTLRDGCSAASSG